MATCKECLYQPILDTYANLGVTDFPASDISPCEIFKNKSDVAEVKHGYSISKMHYSDEFICSECGLIMRDCCRYVIDEDADGDESCYEFEFRYCPNCGAKMDGGTHDRRTA